MRTTVRPNVRLVKSTDVVQVMTAVEQRPATDRKYPLYPHGLLLALGCSLLCWVVIIAVLYRVWH